MARTTECEVKDLIPNTSLTDLNSFITTASLLVDRLAASDCGSDLSADELSEIEKYLAAHFASGSDRTLNLKSEKFENASNTYNLGTAESMSGIMSSSFGQTANTISGGCLEELDKRQPTLLAAGGGCYSD